MNSRWWAALTTALCLVTIALVYVSLYGARPYLPVALNNARTLTIVGANDAAQRQGVRVGDVVPFSNLTIAQSYELHGVHHGKIVEMPVLDGGALRTMAAPATIPVGESTPSFALVSAMLCLLFCLYLGLRRPGAMTFALACSTGAEFLYWPGLSSTFSFLPGALYLFAMNLVRTYASLFGPFALASFVVRLPGSVPNAAKARAIRIVDAIVVTAFLFDFFRPMMGAWGIAADVGHSAYTEIYTVLAVVVLVAASLATYRLSSREEIGRVGIVIGAVLVATILYGWAVSAALPWGRFESALIYDAIGLLVPSALAYAIFRNRVFDLGFVLNRTLVYALTSGIVLVGFALLEFLAERYLTVLTHVEGLALQFGIALLVVLGARVVHERVDALVDSVLFRDRHEQERALRRFATTAQFYTERSALVRETLETIERFARVEGAALYLVEEGALRCVASRFASAQPEIPENDPAFADLRAHREKIDASEYRTSFPGVSVYPLILVGRVTGALVLGERESGETMPPDIDEAVRAVTAAVAMSLESIESARLRAEIETLRATHAIASQHI